MKKKIRNIIEKRRQSKQQSETGTNEAAPRITNETVAAHREQVISGARKYIYPLQHSKHRVVLMSSALLIIAIISFTLFTTISLYRWQKSSTFLYRVTQVIPFPIARTGKYLVAYENYLFELRQYVHFYETQQKLDFNTEEGRLQLALYKQKALENVINTAYIKQIAAQKGVSVTDSEIDEEIDLARNQNRLGGDNEVFEDVLKDYYGWSVSDLRRTIRDKLLLQKVTAALDTVIKDKVASANTRLKNGQDFAIVAKELSEDEFTKDSGGEVSFLVDQTSRDITPEVAEELFKLKPGQFSAPIETSTGYTIVKLLEMQGSKAKIAQIVFHYQDIGGALNDLKDKQKTRIYLNLPEVNLET